MRHIVLLTDHPATHQAVAAALDSNGRLGSGNVYSDLPALTARLESAAPSAVLVDVDMPGSATMFATLEPLIQKHPDTRFLLLSNELRPELLLEAMQIGARNVLLKRSLLAELVPTLRRLCANNASTSQNGAALTVLSAGGGCGATTLAVNLAHELAEPGHQPTLLVDLDWYYSPIPAYLGLGGQFGLLDLVARADAIDADLIGTTVLKYTNDLHVLPMSNTADLAASLAISVERLEDVVAAAKESYKFVVVDAPRLPRDLTLALAKASSLILIVFQLTIKDLRAAKLLMGALVQGGVLEDNLVPVAGRYRKRHLMISEEEAARALGRPVVELLSNDYLAVTQAINFGQPLATAAPRSDVRKDIQKLAQKVARRLNPVPLGVTTR